MVTTKKPALCKKCGATDRKAFYRYRLSECKACVCARASGNRLLNRMPAAEAQKITAALLAAKSALIAVADALGRHTGPGATHRRDRAKELNAAANQITEWVKEEKRRYA